eukprot:Lankesteria_metandrocarpae@DN9481_c0_g1_i1.p2
MKMLIAPLLIALVVVELDGMPAHWTTDDIIEEIRYRLGRMFGDNKTFSFDIVVPNAQEVLHLPEGRFYKFRLCDAERVDSTTYWHFTHSSRVGKINISLVMTPSNDPAAPCKLSKVREFMGELVENGLYCRLSAKCYQCVNHGVYRDIVHDSPNAEVGGGNEGNVNVSQSLLSESSLYAKALGRIKPNTLNKQGLRIWENTSAEKIHLPQRSRRAKYGTVTRRSESIK